MPSNNVYQYSKIRTRKRSAKKSGGKKWNPALFGIRNPLCLNPKSSTRNPESTAWNPESKTVLDSLTWGETRPTRIRNAPHAMKERSPKNVCMRGYIWRKELQKWWEHVLSCYVKTCNTRSKAAHLWKKVTGSISWRNYFKTKIVWTFLALLCSLFLEKRLEILSDEKIEKCNSFLSSLFIFVF